MILEKKIQKRKDLMQMSKDKIPQYHPSYTEEENKAIHEYLEHATAESLAQSIQDFCEAYPGEVRERLLENLNQLRKELLQRLDMEKRYKKLIQCRNKWKIYRDRYIKYALSIEVQKDYKNFGEKSQQKDFGSVGKFESFLDEKRETLCSEYSDEKIRRLLIPHEKKYGTKKPKKPKEDYRSLEDIQVETEINKDVLESLGREELKYILTMLLNCVDYEGTENPANIILLFMTRKYSHTTHKKKSCMPEQNFPLFSSTITLAETTQKCDELLKEIESLKKETEKIRREIKKEEKAEREEKHRE